MTPSHLLYTLLTLAVLHVGSAPLPASAQRMAKAEEPEEVGLVSIGAAYFPVPEGVMEFPISQGSLEEPLNGNKQLVLSGVDYVGDDGSAPEGSSYARQKDGAVLSLRLDVPAAEARPYLFSLWLRSSEEVSGLVTAVSDEIFFGRHTAIVLPSTGGEWKRVGYYLRTPAGATGAQISLRSASKVSRVSLDDLRFREASEAEFSRAYAGWRSQYPERDLSPRPDDGAHLALFLSKLTNPRKPVRPLQVIGIGSSYTNMLGNGERLIQHIRDNFPAAPPVIYRKHVGSAVEFDYTRGWMRQYVLGEQPDLVILYSGGKAEDLEKLLADFSAHSTADVIVASLHLREQDKEITPGTINAPEWDAVREVARKYGCEFVESRQEWAAYVQEHNQGIKWLLKDAVHQSDHGALVINENIIRHITPAEDPAYQPTDRERRLPASPAAVSPAREGEGVELLGNAAASGDAVVLKDKGDALKVTFQGNRLDVVGIRSPGGGHAEVLIDGKHAAEYPTFLTTLIVPGKQNHRPERGLAADRSPHMVRLGKNLVPQDWTIRMVSDQGDYELVGSVTGKDGVGNNGEDFTGQSGQITVPADLWRRRKENDGTYSNRTGDTFTWSVYRATTPEVSFTGDEAGKWFTEKLAWNLENGPHTIEVRALGDSPVKIVGFDVFEPPLK